MPAVLLDTPYGFQANARDISARAVSYFRESVRRQVEVASLSSGPGGRCRCPRGRPGPRFRGAVGVFRSREPDLSPCANGARPFVPRLLAEKVLYGGCIVFSSAAALTLGRWTVPVYEIYKVGADPVWAEGLDLLTPLG